MKAFIINLPAATDRFQFQSEQMSRLKIEYEMLSAVSIDDISDDEYRKKSMMWERPLRKAELACFLSHFNAWGHVRSSGRPALILEDDAVLANQTPKILDELEKMEFYDLVTLEVRNRKKTVGAEMEFLNQIFLLPLYQDRTGAAAYVLSPSGAEILLNKANSEALGLADAFISSTYQLRAFQVEPAAAIQLDQCDVYGVASKPVTHSSILAEKKPQTINMPLLQKIIFKVRRIASQLKMGIRYMSVSHKASRRYIELRSSDYS